MSRPTRKARQPETMWLSSNQQRAWRHVVALLLTLPSALDGDLQRAAGLTMFEYTVLANLSEADKKTLRMSDLADRANSSLSRLSHVVSRLERNGYVLKRPSANDGRVSEAVLTKAGAAKVTEAAPHHVARVRELVIKPLTANQLSHLGEAASAIADRIAEVGAAAGRTSTG